MSDKEFPPLNNIWTDKGTQLLEPGTRKSIVDPNVPDLRSMPQKEALDFLFEIMNNNVQKRRKPKKIILIDKDKDRMKGLFGGGE
jgi:hypothetical protein